MLERLRGLRPGVRLCVEWQQTGDGALHVQRVSQAPQEGLDVLESIVHTVDVARRRLWLQGIEVEVPEGMTIHTPEGAERHLRELRPGDRLRVCGELRDSCRLAPRELRLCNGNRAGHHVLESRLESVDTRTGTLRLAGVEVRVSNRTVLRLPESSGVLRPESSSREGGEMQDFYEFNDLKIGMRISVEGEYTGHDSMRAQVLTLKQDGELDEMEGFIETLDPAATGPRLFGLSFDMDDSVAIRDLEKRPSGVDALTAGTRIKTKGHVSEDRRFKPVKIKIKTATPDAQDEIEGPITAIDAENRTVT
ncbi:MAG: hypothetical protein ACE5G2_13535, partial [Candidatus Krumholzibacteriia bacterium]